MLAIVVLLILTVTVALYLIRRDRGAKESRLMLMAAFGFGALAVIISIVIEGFAIPFGLEDIETQSIAMPSLLFFGLLIGIIEEGAKAIPLALFIRKKSYFNEYTDGVIYFALSGLSFSLIEDAFYILEYGSGVGIFRLVISPFLHAAASGIFGYYLVQSKITKKSLQKPALALGAVMLLHGLYDFGLFSGATIFIVLSLMITALLNAGLFLYYSFATKADQGLGQSVIGINKYCRNCGNLNQGRTLYCRLCGAKT